MARIPDAFIDELLARTDIVEVVGGRVPLKRQGKEYSARCPFHDERSASFTVSPTKQFNHCFGCGAHGTAISFLMNYDRLEFLDAVDELAKRAGMEIPPERAIRWLTSNAAKALGIEQQTGALEPGKMGDMVVWNGNPFSSYALAEQVYIDGAQVYDRHDRRLQPVSDFMLGQEVAR